jgi:hypothetical protein
MADGLASVQRFTLPLSALLDQTAGSKPSSKPCAKTTLRPYGLGQKRRNGVKD